MKIINFNLLQIDRKSNFSVENFFSTAAACNSKKTVEAKSDFCGQFFPPFPRSSEEL
jgi:hypothetical protein